MMETRSPDCNSDVIIKPAFTDQTVASVTGKKKPLIGLDSFAWSEDKDFVKIYVDFEGPNRLDDSRVQFVSSISLIIMKQSLITYELLTRNGQKMISNYESSKMKMNTFF
jgi:hypothetical protein